MATNKTSFLNLNDWAGSDQFRREEINANFRALDAKAKEHDDSIGNLSKAASEYEWTSAAGQLTYVLPAGQTYDPTTKWFEVTVGGAPVPLSQIQMDSASQFTLLVDASAIPAGVKVVARWTEPFVPATAGHHTKHEAGGTDEIDITKLKNFNEQVASPLAESSTQINFLSGLVVSILKYQDKAVLQPDGNLDWAPVFNYMQTQAMTPFVPYGTWNIYSRITPRRIQGIGRQRSIINQKTLTEPVIETNGIVFFSDFKIQHDSMPNSLTIPDGVGILITGTTDGSVMQRLEINNVTSGICLNGTGHVYSTSFRDIRITNFNHSAMHIGGTGHTGNVLQNIYAVNWLDYNAGTKRTSQYGYYFKGMDEGVFQQINLEHGFYGKGIAVSGSGLIMDSVHFEGFEANQDYGGLFAIDGTNTKVLLRNITLVYSKFDSSKAPNYSVISLDNAAKVDILGFREENNTVVGTPTLRKFYGAGNIVSGAYIKARMFHMLNNLFGVADYFPNTPTNPYVRQFNDEGLVFTPITASNAQKQQLFIDSADGKLKFKDNTGTVNLLY